MQTHLVLGTRHEPKRRELTSVGIPVTAETLKQQLELAYQLDFIKLQYHQGLLTNRGKAKERENGEKMVDRRYNI